MRNPVYVTPDGLLAVSLPDIVAINYLHETTICDECSKKYDNNLVIVQLRNDLEDRSLDASYGPDLVKAWVEWGEHGK